jgi:RNA polymerase sigma-70 factor, ECF subfamily
MTDTERRSLFNRVYAKYEKRVFAYCIYVVGDRDRANDVFQEVFIKTYNALHTLRDMDKMVNWLFRIARNECLNAMKVNQRNLRRNVDIDDPIHTAKVAQEPDSYNDEFDHLRWGIKQLPVEYREPLVLAEFEGLSMKEISQLTGTSVSNVKVRIHRAKQKLHALLQPILNDYE